jgi:hypothetical protein
MAGGKPACGTVRKQLARRIGDAAPELSALDSLINDLKSAAEVPAITKTEKVLVPDGPWQWHAMNALRGVGCFPGVVPNIGAVAVSGDLNRRGRPLHDLSGAARLLPGLSADRCRRLRETDLFARSEHARLPGSVLDR